MSSTGGSGLARLLAPVDVSNRDSVSVEITRKLLDYLLSGHVQPGERLPPERKLAEALGVGRSVVREALKSLTLLGLMEVRRGDGTYLKRADAPLLPPSIEWGLVLSSRDAQDLVELRAQLEVTVAGLAAERRDGATIEELRRLLVRMLLLRSEADSFLVAQSAFDALVASAAQNEILAGILSTVRSLLQGRMTRAGHLSLDLQASLDDHALLLDALARQDAEAARVSAARYASREDSRLQGASGEVPGLSSARPVGHRTGSSGVVPRPREREDAVGDADADGSAVPARRRLSAGGWR